jgi:multidrug efflux system membrane fusion protein
MQGLGSVQALNTVRIGTRIDGHLVSMALREGQEVKAGEVLAHIDARPYQAAVRQSEANLRRDQAELRGAKIDLERMLAARAYTSGQSIDNQRAKVEQLEATIDSDQAQIDSARVQLDYATIRSPIAGRVGLRSIDPGNIVRADDASAIVVVTQLHPIGVVFTLPEDALAAVRIQLASGRSLDVSAYGRDERTRLAEGVLSTIDNTVDRKTGTFRLKAIFANDDDALWPGQFISAQLHLGVRRDCTVVPESAVQLGPDGPYVYVIQPDGAAAIRAVAAGAAQDGFAVIERGLQPGERIVTEGQHRLKPGSRVAEVAQEAARAPERRSAAATP